MRMFKAFVVFIGLMFSAVSVAEEMTEELAAKQMGVLLKSYYSPTLKTLQKLGTIVPYVAYVKTDGTLGHFDLEGAQPTFDIEQIGKYISVLYGKILPKREEYLVISVFAVTQIQLEGKPIFALTAMMEHQAGFGYQKVWPLEETSEGLKISKPIQIKYNPVIYADN
ncbi:hypothetical protein ACFOEK_01210 [Litoribrevibacter euphylliae]|uniref:Uncharacterized protein n=1 Tax=Litoribrevibacter euphylliae TaxID=1834034 RepID=A0ABV7H6V2_9GAMM